MVFNSLLGESVHVYVDEKFLKLVKTKKVSGKKQITGIYCKNIAGLSADGVSSEIRAGMASLKTSVRHVTVVLPSKYAITKNIEVPSLEKEEIESIIRLQAVRHTPYSKEEVIVGHINLEQILERYTKVLLVIVSNENIRKKTDLFELAGYDIEAVHLSADVLVRLVQMCRPFQADQSPCGLVYVESDSTDFIIVHKAKPYFIRSISVGWTQLKQDMPAAVRQLLDEFKKTCEAYQSEDQGAPVKRFLAVAAGNEAGTALLKGLKDEFGTEAEAVSLEDNLPLAPEARQGMDSVPGGTLLDVFADGLSADEFTVDLLPEDLKVRKSFKEKGKEIFTAAIFVLLILILSVSVFLAKIYFRNDYLQEITKNFEAKQNEATELDTISDETRQVRDFEKKRGTALKTLDAFGKVLPQEMYLSEISLTADGHVSVKGTSKLMSSVFSFVTELENGPYFKTVTSDYTKSRKENDKDVSDFGLSALLKDPSEHG